PSAGCCGFSFTSLISDKGTFQRRGGGGIQAARHASGQVGSAAGNHRMLHGFGHQYRLLGGGDGGVHQHPGAAQLHGDGGIGSGTDPGVNQNRHGGLFQDDAQVVGVADAQTGTDQAGQRHYRDAADVGQLAGNDGVVTG